ncbi:MAG: phenylalanine--tRNA ligase beta subunit-related protein [Anaerolineales bacterium]|jgi:DNA/RNA-binding domain of Phe-tRNA-synthetase-like protein
MLPIQAAEAWHTGFPGAHIGLLLVGPVDNTPRPSPLDEAKISLAAQLRTRFGGYSRAELNELPVLAAYKNYYRQFNKTYHVLLQLESVVHKHKSLPAINPMVDAGFAAELETLILTAAHDADTLVPPITISASTGEEQMRSLTGSLKQLKAGDMIMLDAQGVVCSILYGQDQRTPLTPHSRQVLYVAYAPAGITAAQVNTHLETILHYVRLCAPGIPLILQDVLAADQA